MNERVHAEKTLGGDAGGLRCGIAWVLLGAWLILPSFRGRCCWAREKPAGGRQAGRNRGGDLCCLAFPVLNHSAELVRGDHWQVVQRGAGAGDIIAHCAVFCERIG